MKWPFLQQIFVLGTSSLTLFVLASMLGPAAVGVWGMAAAFVAVLTSLSDVGVSSALIQRHGLTPAHESSAFAVNAVLGAGLSIIGTMLSPLAGQIFDDPRVVPITAGLSAQLAVRGLGATHTALIHRELRFRALALRDLFAGVLGMVAGILMSLGGAGTASFVGAALVSAVTGTVTAMLIGRRRIYPTRASWAATRELWNYGSSIFGFNAFKALAQNADRIIIGAALGAHAAGLYAVARSVVLTPVSAFSSALGFRFFPLLSRAQTNVHDVQRIFGEAQKLAHVTVPRVLAAVLLPLTLFLLAASDSTWRDLLPIIWIMAGVGCIQALFAPVGQLMKAIGRPDWLLAWSILVWVITTACLLAGARWGVSGSVIGFFAAHVVLLLPNQAIPRRLLHNAHVRSAAESARARLVSQPTTIQRGAP